MTQCTPIEADPAAPPVPRMRGALLGGACLSLQPLLLSALMLPVTAYVVRGLGPTAYGQWATATAIVAVVTFVANLGLRGAFVRSVARSPASAEAAFAEQMGARTGLSLVAAALAVGLSVALRHPPVVVLCTGVSAAGLLLMTVSTTAADTLQALQRLPTVAGANVAAGLSLSLASVVAVRSGAGPVAVAASYLVGSAVSSALLLAVIRRRHFRPRVRWDARRCGSLLRAARFLGAQQFVFSVANNAEALIIPGLVGPTVFGFFSAGALLANRLTAIPEGLCSAAYPAMVDARRAGTRAVVAVFLRFLAVDVLACAAAALAVGFLAPAVAGLLFPGQSEVCERVMRVTIWLLPALGVHSAVGYLFNALDMDAEQARASFAGAVASLGLTCLLVWRFGIVGASWSMVLRYVVHLVAQAPYVVRIVRSVARPSRPTAPAAPPAAATAAPGVVGAG